jgi:hypothetical protein
MFKLFANKLRKELEEIRSLHRIQIKEKEAEIDLLKRNAQQEIEMKTREVISLLKLEADQKNAQLQIDSEKKINEIRHKASEDLLVLKEKVLMDFQEKFTAATAKLHEEGNVTTKFVQDLALNMMGKQPTAKFEAKMITKAEDKSE